MYKCELYALVPELKSRGPHVSGPGERCTRVVVQHRPAEYRSRGKAQKVRVGRKIKHFDDPGGTGYQIAKEAMACPTCAAEYERLGLEPATVEG